MYLSVIFDFILESPKKKKICWFYGRYWKIKYFHLKSANSHCTWFIFPLYLIFWIHFSDVKKIPNHFSFMLYMLVFNNIYMWNSNTLGSFDSSFVVSFFIGLNISYFDFLLGKLWKKPKEVVCHEKLQKCEIIRATKKIKTTFFFPKQI